MKHLVTMAERKRVPQQHIGSGRATDAKGSKPSAAKKPSGSAAKKEVASIEPRPSVLTETVKFIHEDNFASMKVAERNKMQSRFKTKFLDMPVVVFATD